MFVERWSSGYASLLAVSTRKAALGRAPTEVREVDDGSPITPEVRAHLFEPFYTTSSKGTGLGLYLARELCLNNNAMLDYEYHAGEGGEPAGGRFVITMAMATLH